MPQNDGVTDKLLGPHERDDRWLEFGKPQRACYCRHDYHESDCPEGWPEGEALDGYEEPSPEERAQLDDMGSSNT